VSNEGVKVNLAEAGKQAGDIILTEVKAALKDRWDKLTEREREVLTRATVELGKETAKGTLGGGVDASRLMVLQATLANFRVVGAFESRQIQSAFWTGVKNAAKVLGPILADIAAGALKNLASGVVSDLTDKIGGK
jgi:hypothetical protein